LAGAIVQCSGLSPASARVLPCHFCGWKWCRGLSYRWILARVLGWQTELVNVGGRIHSGRCWGIRARVTVRLSMQTLLGGSCRKRETRSNSGARSFVRLYVWPGLVKIVRNFEDASRDWSLGGSILTSPGQTRTAV
jgi:hypothetical protein